MNRRSMLRQLCGVAVPTVIIAAANDGLERPLMLVAPFCPRCGYAAYYMRGSRYIGDVVPVQCPNTECGWTGGTPNKVPMK